MRFSIKDLRPSVDRRVLFILSGITWTIVGFLLCSYAIGWLFQKEKGFLFAFVGLLASLIIHRFGFLGIVENNINRILKMERKVCIFAFQAWKSYIMISVMMGLGIFLRHLPVPKYYLSVIYMGIGFALILSSIRYYRVFFFTTPHP